MVGALESPGSLLREWRIRNEWTQSELADVVGVTAAAVSAWETGSRRIMLDSLVRLDAVLGADGCLIDLVRAIGSCALEPRSRWGHIFAEPGPAWVWLRTADGARLRGTCHGGLLGYAIDHPPGPGGVFAALPMADPRWDVRVELEGPAWVDFGRGTPPSWLDLPMLSSVALVLTRPRDKGVGFYIEAVRRRDRGDPDTLRDRLRILIGAERWDILERQVLATDAPPTEPPGPPDAPWPPRTAEERRRLHRLLRETRGLSQVDAAEMATRIARTSRPPTAPSVRPVTAMQVHNYEHGRTSRTRHLPALLDLAYGGYGWTCFERVPVARRSSTRFEVPFPGFWLGPVTLAVRPAGVAHPGGLTLTWPTRRRDRALPAHGGVLGFVRRPGDGTLTVETPAGWLVEAWMGYDPDATDALGDWVPYGPEAEDQAVELLEANVLGAFGITACDVRHALSGNCEPDGS
ncbi:helix-turn-helix domain-containing protein [Nocardioides sp. LHG3406-4]|uniref:helix-turn-helix domain-containing protein n=1 Tax=Nocardioides sp. LHG3406-4 TaxID=2804575 RepID=UPI003CE9F634